MPVNSCPTILFGSHSVEEPHKSSAKYARTQFVRRECWLVWCVAVYINREACLIVSNERATQIDALTFSHTLTITMPFVLPVCLSENCRNIPRIAPITQSTVDLDDPIIPVVMVCCAGSVSRTDPIQEPCARSFKPPGSHRAISSIVGHADHI